MNIDMNPNRCIIPQCVESFDYSTDQTSDLKSFQCFRCNCVFSDMTLRDNHILYSHNNFFNTYRTKGTQIKCPECSSLFGTKDFEEHVAWEHQWSIFRLPNTQVTCSRCCQTFVGHFQDHKKLNCTNWTRTYIMKKLARKCKICKVIVDNSTQLVRHMYKCHTSKKVPTKVSKNKEELIECSKCSNKYTNLSTLSQHMIQEHKVLRKLKLAKVPPIPLVCELCGWSKSHKVRQMERHMFYIHKQKDNAKIICEDCGEPFMTYGYLNKHRSVKHSDERPHVCSYCCQTFKQRRTLQAHVKYKHQEHKSCQYCKESFDNSADLYRHHEWIHPQESQQVEIDGVTVLECDICGKVMGSKTALYTHNKNSHGVIQKASKIETIIRHAGRL